MESQILEILNPRAPTASAAPMSGTPDQARGAQPASAEAVQSLDEFELTLVGGGMGCPVFW